MLVLVRHGRTEANAGRKLQGLLDLPLDEVGMQQAADVASWLGTPDRVISSPLLRARQTAEAFGLPYEVDERWVDFDYGSLDGLAISDVGEDVGPGGTWTRRVPPAMARAWMRCTMA